jgi:S-adenosylmethionine hydrolase
VGEGIDAGSLMRISTPEPVIEAGRVTAHVISVDRFGNAALDLADRHLPQSGLRMGRAVTVEIAGSARDAIFARTFADVQEGVLLLYEDSSGSLALAVNRGDAATELGLARGAEVTLRPAG